MFKIFYTANFDIILLANMDRLYFRIHKKIVE